MKWVGVIGILGLIALAIYHAMTINVDQSEKKIFRKKNND